MAVKVPPPEQNPGPAMRYVAAMLVSAMLIGAGALFVRHMERSIGPVARASLAMPRAGGSEPNADETVESPAGPPWRLRLAQFLVTWRGILIGLILLASLSTARAYRPQPR